MVLISLDPFAARRVLLIIAAVIGFSALCFADPVLMARRYADRPELQEKAEPSAKTASAPFAVLADSAWLSEPATSELPFATAAHWSQACVLRSPISGADAFDAAAERNLPDS